MLQVGRMCPLSVRRDEVTTMSMKEERKAGEQDTSRGGNRKSTPAAAW